jgi:murein DD-endopeptidase MepM/ murein hydrolase activator NlpD
MSRAGRTIVRTQRILVWIGFLVGTMVLMHQPSDWAADDPRFTSSAVALETAAAGPLLEEHLAEVQTVRLRPGEPMASAFQKAGVIPPELAPALRRLAELVDVRRVRPTDLFLLYRSRHGELRRLEYDRGGLEDRVVLEPGGSDFRAYVEPKRVERKLRKIEGVVESSLYESMEKAGGDAGLVVSFADLFAWDFDFFTDTRNGDRYDLLVEEVSVEGRGLGFGKVLAGRYWPQGADRPLDAFLHGQGDDGGEYYTSDGRSVRKFFLKSPLNFRRISSQFTTARLHPIFKTVRPHLGVDYAAPLGTPVVALGGGRVIAMGWRGGFGRTLQIRHNTTYITQYAHLNAYADDVHPGVRVKQGEVIGFVGRSGDATGPHLDFRVQENGRWVNPLALKGGDPEPLPEGDRPAFAQTVERMTGLLDSLPAGAVVSLDAPAAFPQALTQLDTSQRP